MTVPPPDTAAPSVAASVAPPLDPFLPEGRVVPLAGRGETFVRIHEGAGAHAPAVLLLHGWGATADLNWFSLYRPLAERYRVVAIDHRGHGRGLRGPHPFALDAAADDAAEALQALGVGPVIAAGYSMGGPIALHLAHRHPELVGGLVLAATALQFRSTWLDRLQWLGMPALGVAARWDVGRRVARRIIDDTAADDALMAAWREHLIGEAARGTVPEWLDAGRSLQRYDAHGWADLLDVPAAVVVTVGDRLVHPRRQRALAEALRARIVELEGDHDVFLRNGSAFASAVTAAVDGVAARLGSGLTPPGAAADRRTPHWVSRRRRAITERLAAARKSRLPTAPGGGSRLD